MLHCWLLRASREGAIIALGNDESRAEYDYAAVQERIRKARLTEFQNWLKAKHGLVFEDYEALWRWSTTDLDAFWQSVWDYFDIQSPNGVMCHLKALEKKGLIRREGFRARAIQPPLCSPSPSSSSRWTACWPKCPAFRKPAS